MDLKPLQIHAGKVYVVEKITCAFNGSKGTPLLMCFTLPPKCCTLSSGSFYLLLSATFSGQKSQSSLPPAPVQKMQTLVISFSYDMSL